MSRLKAWGIAAAFLALGACVDEPAGGPGPFDPPRPEPVNSPLFATPGASDFRPFPDTAPRGTPETEADAIAADVTAALRSTGTPSAAEAEGAAPEGPSVGPVPGSDTATASADPFQQDIGIDPNDTSIDLNQQSQAEQERQREIAARRREAAREQLEIVEPEPIEQVDPNANVIAFARGTTHPVGTKVYNRPAFRDRLQNRSTCARFSSPDEAQRQFLANGGPQTDRFNLDPDGDGFACRFDPEPYRQLQF